ncbi:MAG: hypothetical protein AB7O26_00290 [Planctomycetaceae bacterium]
MEAANRRPRLWLSVLALMLAVQISPWFYPTGDGSMYLSTVREFLSSEDLSEFRCFVPPGYVAMILPTFLVSDRPFLALSVMNWFLGVALLIGVYYWSRRQFPSVAVLLTAIVMVNISVWTYYRRPLKETAFMAVLIWTVNLLQEFLGPERSRRYLLRGAAASGLLALLSLIRYPGITVAIGFGAAMLLQAVRGRITWSRAFVTTSAITILPITLLGSWLVYDKYYVGGAVYWHEIVSVYTDDIDGTSTNTPQRSGGEGGASSPLAEYLLSWLPARDSHFMTAVVPQFLSGLQYRITDIGCMTIPGLWKAVPEPGNWLDVWSIVYVAFFLLLLVGWFRLVRRKTDVLILTLPAYFLLYVHWVCDQPGGRFMLPMLPAVIACGWYGFGPKRQLRVAMFSLLLFLHLGQASAYWLLIDAPRAAKAHDQWPTVDHLAASIKAEPRPVGAHDVPLEMFLALGLTLDKDTPLQTVADPIDPSIHWIVAPADGERIPGFVLRESIGGFSLLYRRPDEMATAVVNPQPQVEKRSETLSAVTAARAGNSQPLSAEANRKALSPETLQ